MIDRRHGGARVCNPISIAIIFESKQSAGAKNNKEKNDDDGFFSHGGGSVKYKNIEEENRKLLMKTQ